MDQYRFQWSKKLDNGEIYVCHADTKEELEEAINDIGFLIGKKGTNQTMEPYPTEKPSTSQPSESEDTITCPIHKSPMKKREGKFGEFYSHYVGKYPNGEYCNGK